MTGALVRKELRELRPWVVLGFVFAALDVVDEVLSRPVLRPLGDSFSGLADFSVAVLWLLAFAIGTTLGTREADDGTLGFLDGLPVTRTRVFLVKLLTAAGALFLWPGLRAGLAVGLHLAARGSLDHTVHAGLVLQLLALEALAVLSGLGLGAALGHLRSLTWLALGCAGVGLGLLTERLPRAALLDPMSLAEVQLVGTRLHVDGEAVGVQAALAALWAVVAWAGFVGTGRPRWLDLSKRPVVSALVAVLTVAAVVGAVALRSDDAADAADGGGADASGAPGAHFAASAPASTSTLHYRFSYPANRAREALALAEGADAVFEEVHRQLQVPPGPPIDVDASGSRRATAGTAFSGGLRLQLGGDARAVLAHETSHVVSRRVAGDERAWLWQAAPVLNEGLASWVERRFSGRAEERREDALTLAALHRRGELLLEDLVDAERLAKTRDDGLKYAAGEALIDATVRVYGPGALPRLLAAFGDERLPQDLEGLPLWQACFQVAGLDLGRVVDDFFREVDDAARARADELAALPRPRVVLLKADGWYGAKAVVDAPLPDGWRLALRFRPGPDSDFSSYDTYVVAPDEPQWREAKQVRKAQLCVQAGLKLKHGNTLYEPWACLPVRDAVPWTTPEDEAGDEAADEGAAGGEEAGAPAEGAETP